MNKQQIRDKIETPLSGDMSLPTPDNITRGINHVCLALKGQGASERDIRNYIEASELYLQWDHNWRCATIDGNNGEYCAYCEERRNKYGKMKSDILSSIASRNTEMITE